MQGKMKAGRLHAINDIRCDEVDIPQIKDDEVLLRVYCAGICGSDLGRVFSTGTYHFPTTLGHEFGGEIVEIGKGVKDLDLREELKVGQRVDVNPMTGCGKCKDCLNGNINLCDTYGYTGSRSDGGFGQYVAVKSTQCYVCPDDFSWDMICQIDPAVISLHGALRAGIKVNDAVVVFGTGPVGYYMVQWANICGARMVIAVDIKDEKLDLIKKVGATYTINSLNMTNEEVVAKIKEYTGEDGPEVCIEAAGSPITFNQALQCLKKHGTFTCIGTPHGDVNVLDKSYDKCILRKELTIKGSWCYNFTPEYEEFCATIDAAKKGLLDLTSIISHRFKVDDVKDAFALIERKEFFNKIVITQDGYEPGK